MGSPKAKRVPQEPFTEKVRSITPAMFRIARASFVMERLSVWTEKQIY